MLNICMERRRIREGGLPFSMSTGRGGSASSGQDESEDEFYDCPEDVEEGKYDIYKLYK